MRVLLVEDDAATAASIKMMLVNENFICDTTDLGEDGLEIGKLYDYDIILLDLMLPDIDGYEVLRRLRAARVRTPILILSGLAELDHKIKGLGFGADDFLTKPFDRRELIARIQAIVRRSKGHSESTIRTGKLVVNLDTRVVSVDDQPVHLTGKEYGILELLSLRKGTTLTKEMFLNHLYGGMDEPELKIIDVFVCKLRKKLAQATGGSHYIETVWGRGYVLRDPVALPGRRAPRLGGGQRRAAQHGCSLGRGRPGLAVGDRREPHSPRLRRRDQCAVERFGEQAGKIGLDRPASELGDRRRQHQRGALPGTERRLRRPLRGSAGVGQNQTAAARQRIGPDREEIAGQFLPVAGQRPDALGIIAGDTARLEKAARELVRRRARERGARLNP